MYDRATACEPTKYWPEGLTCIVPEGILVPSKSQAGTNHLVQTINGELVCDCLGFQYRGKCRHVKIVSERIK